MIILNSVFIVICKQQMTLIKAQAGVKNNMRRLNKSIIQQGSNHVVHVVLFALFCFFLVYLWSKFSRRWKAEIKTNYIPSVHMPKENKQTSAFNLCILNPSYWLIHCVNQFNIINWGRALLFIYLFIIIIIIMNFWMKNRVWFDRLKCQGRGGDCCWSMFSSSVIWLSFFLRFISP